ncbi:porin family protein [Flavobacterium turcicum]|uniref:PorT family protein n=1 Tax=Flavobacterium turcicum TaxID=2764718 RepID=A0ABR7JG73_9FLAO|nr:porin family protein [Flavobacterium turcicum]MBC5863467.1 PorT family protein [Flavobacterium turcicum]NHL02583.1 PorT family protein [Flavobacterium turcicum]
MKNLKNILALVLVLAGVSQIQAQENSPSIGIKGGYNMSNLYTEDVDDQNLLSGFNVGLFATLPISSSLAIQPELNYTTKGAELRYDNLFAQGTAKFRLNYVEVPVLVKANLTKNFNVHFGPYAAFLIDSKITNEGQDGNINFEESIDKDDLNTVDIGVAAGVGFDFDKFGIGARYNYGLTTVGKERNFAGGTYTFPDSKNSVLSIYAAIKF